MVGVSATPVSKVKLRFRKVLQTPQPQGPEVAEGGFEPSRLKQFSLLLNENSLQGSSNANANFSGTLSGKRLSERAFCNHVYIFVIA